MAETLTQLIARWRQEQADYPKSAEGQSAAAAVRLCAEEIERWARVHGARLNEAWNAAQTVLAVLKEAERDAG